jgi:hypothetical protein
LPTDDFYPQLMGFTEDRDDWIPINDRFVDLKFETRNTIMNMGSLFVVYIWIVVKLFIMLIFGILVSFNYG